MQVLFTQLAAPPSADWQMMLQAPQCMGSLVTSVHAGDGMPQETRPAGQEHAPAMQLAPVGQAFPHTPQFVGLLWRLMQPVPAQSVSPAAQLHWPLTQPSPETEQTVAQLPQCAGSLARLTHPTAPQSAVPAGHTHVLPLHAMVAPQAALHPPQFIGSLASFTHAPPQLVSPVGHTHVLLRHAPLPQSDAAAQVLPRTHLEHFPPPQSMSVSAPFFTPSAQLAGPQLCMASQTRGKVQSAEVLQPTHVPARGLAGSAHTPWFGPRGQGVMFGFTI